MALPGLVLVHGGGLAADSWELTVEEIHLLAPDLTVLALDMPGWRNKPGDLREMTLAVFSHQRVNDSLSMCGMPKRLVLEQVRTVPVNVEDGFRGTLMHLATACRRRYGLIPPVSRVTGNVGEWGTVGSSRTLVLSGSGSVREEVVRVDAPYSFGVAMSDITGPLFALVAQIQSEFLFAPAGTGTRITWRYILHARSALATPALPVIGWSWRGFARQALEELSEMLVA